MGLKENGAKDKGEKTTLRLHRAEESLGLVINFSKFVRKPTWFTSMNLLNPKEKARFVKDQISSRTSLATTGKFKRLIFTSGFIYLSTAYLIVLGI